MVKIEWEQYDSAEQGVTYLATYADRPYSCVLPAEDLELATRGDEVHDAFRRRMAEIERATESTLRRQTEAGRVVAANLVVVRLADRLVSHDGGVAILHSQGAAPAGRVQIEADRSRHKGRPRRK
jgi:hypothetical protein